MPAASWRACATSDVMLDTLKTLDLPAGLEWELRKAIQAHRARNGGDVRRTAAAGVVAMLQRGARAGRAIGRSSATRSMRCARGSSAHTAAAAATSRRRRADPTVEALHEWRKRVKDLWYHHTLLRELWPPVMRGRRADEAHAAGRPARRRPRPRGARRLGARARRGGARVLRGGGPSPLRAAGRGDGPRRAPLRGQAEAPTRAGCDGCGTPRRHLLGHPNTMPRVSEAMSSV